MGRVPPHWPLQWLVRWDSLAFEGNPDPDNYRGFGGGWDQKYFAIKPPPK